MKHFLPLFLAAITIIAGIAGNVYKCDHWGIAVAFYVVCGVLFILTLIVGFYESIPKPHIVPAGYGGLSGRQDGLLFKNDGEPAYNVEPPKPTKLEGIGDSTMFFDDPAVLQLTKDDEPRCFPITIKDSLGGQKINDLQMQLALTNANPVLVSFRYADGKKPKLPRYISTFKVEIHSQTPKGIAVRLDSCKFDWRHLFW
jgi:hypothetical protein